MKKLVHCTLAGLLVLQSYFSIPGIGYKVEAASDSKITPLSATGKSSSGQEASKAIDGKLDTFWLSPSASSMQDHNRSIDIDLGGVYDLSRIKIYNKEGAYYNYQIYASESGRDFNKIAYKNNSDLATAAGDEYFVSEEEDAKKVSKLRIHVGYSSQQLEVNLKEVEIYGTKVSDEVPEKKKITIEDYAGSDYDIEQKKFASDASYAKTKVLNEMNALVARVIGESWQRHFTFELTTIASDQNDVFEIENGADGNIVIRGNDGVSLASGFNYYLKNFANVNYNPVFSSQVDMPTKLPPVDQKIVKETQYESRYALNFCTYSYTMAFWSWEEYEALLDWLAMNGVNVMLDIVGQEEVLRKTFLNYGYSDDEIKDFITGPAFFAWFYMQNTSGYGGPLPDSWFEQRVDLGRKMHERMQTYGISPVLQGFSGMVPNNFKEKNPDATIITQGDWVGFTRPDMLRTYVDGQQRDYFSEMADDFYKAQKEVFGDITDYYAVDPFHEGGKTGDMDIKKVYNLVQKEMLAADSDAIWIIQEWSGGLTEEKMAALENKEQALVLDLFSEVSSYASRMENQKVPWIWNMLHNFGGRMGIDGEIEKVSQNIPNAYANSNYMKGIGITPESLSNGPIMYDLVFDMTWTKDPIDYRKYVENYTKSRYGSSSEDIKEAWSTLLDTGYSKKEGYYQGAPESVINARPVENYTSASSWGHSNIMYDKEEFDTAVLSFIKAYPEFKDKDTFVYDFVDVTKQMLSNSAQEYHKLMIDAYRNKDIEEFTKISDHFLELIRLQDDILGCSEEFLVGTWIDKSRGMLDNADDWTNDLFEFNARSLITTWGAQRGSSSLRDYSNRQWSGLTSDFYLKRWEMFVANYKEALTNKTAPKAINYFMWEWQWVNQKSDESKAYTTQASGADLAALAQTAYDEFSISTMSDFLDKAPIEDKVNIAKGKSVTTTSQTIEGSKLSNLTDDNLSTNWKSNTFPTELILDLGGKKSVDGIAFALEQIPTVYPIAYKISVWNDGAWQKIAEKTEGTINGTISIDYIGSAEKVKYEFSCSDSSITPDFYELMVYGGVEPEPTEINYAKGLMPKLEGGWDTSLAITDGDLNTKWVAGGITSCEDFRRTVHIDLGKEQYVDVVEVYLEKEQLCFGIEIYYLDGAGKKVTLLDELDNKGPLPDHYILDVNANIKRLYVDFNSSERVSQGGTCPSSLANPALREIKILKYLNKEISTNNVAINKPISGSPTERPKEYANDGNYKTLWVSSGGAVPSEATIDLGEQKHLEKGAIHFEAAGRKFMFKIETLDEKDVPTVVFDKTKLSADETANGLQAKYEFPIGKDAVKVKVSFTGVIGSVQGNPWPAFSELELFAKPENISTNASVQTNVAGVDANVLKDNDTSTFVESSVAGNKEFTFTFQEPKDIFGFELMKQMSQSANYKVEYQSGEDLSDQEWKIAMDRSANTALDQVEVVELKNPIFARNLRFTFFNPSIKVSDINIYKADVSDQLVAYINSVTKKTSAYTIGAYAGNYSLEAKENLDAAIAKAKDIAANEPNYLQVKKATKELKVALQDFFSGYVTVSRDALRLAIADTELQIKQVKPEYEELIVALQNANNAARTVYDTFKVTQEELDIALENVKEATEKIIAVLPILEQVELQMNLAKATLENITVGEMHGNVTQETFDTLANAIKKAEKDMLAAGENASALTQVLTTLKEQIALFNDAIIIVQKADLEKALAYATTLDKAEYSKDSWSAMQEVLGKAQTIFDSESISQKQVDDSTLELNNAYKALVEVNRKGLRDLLAVYKDLTESQYTTDSWAIFAKAFTEAEKCLAETQVNQSDLDAAYDNVQKAKEQLVVKSIPNEKVDTIASSNGIGSIHGSFDAGAELFIDAHLNGMFTAIVKSIVDQEFVKSVNFERIFNIYMMKKGSDYTIDGKSTISLKLDRELLNKKLSILYISETGEIEKIPSVVKDGFIIFDVTHLSNYAIISAKENTEIPNPTPLPTPENPDSPKTDGDVETEDSPTLGSDTETGDATNVFGFILIILSSGYICLKLQRKLKK